MFYRLHSCPLFHTEDIAPSLELFHTIWLSKNESFSLSHAVIWILKQGSIRIFSFESNDQSRFMWISSRNFLTQFTSRIVLRHNFPMIKVTWGSRELLAAVTVWHQRIRHTALITHACMRATLSDDDVRYVISELKLSSMVYIFNDLRYIAQMIFLREFPACACARVCPPTDCV